jgi:hypothetical protein
MGLLAAKFSVSGQLCEERTLDWGATLDERSSLGSQADIHCSQTWHSKAALKTAEKSQTLPIAVRMKVSAFSQLLWSFGRLRRGDFHRCVTNSFSRLRGEWGKEWLVSGRIEI